MMNTTEKEKGSENSRFQSIRLKLTLPIINFKLQIYEKYFNPKGNEVLFYLYPFWEAKTLYLAKYYFYCFLYRSRRRHNNQIC